jgi:hypothetical protein
MIRKSVERFSEEIVPNQKAKARRRFDQISLRFGGARIDRSIGED